MGANRRDFLRSAAVATLLVFATVNAFAEQPVEANPGPDSALLRLALSVADLEASKRFYSYALGYTVGFEGEITSPWVSELLQLEDGQTATFVVMKGPDAIGDRSVSSAMIGLMFIDNPPLPAIERPGPGTIATGEGVMAIVTSDIATVYERLRELDAQVLHPPALKPDGSETELVTYDPDGLRIHVVQTHDVE